MKFKHIKMLSITIYSLRSPLFSLLDLSLLCIVGIIPPCSFLPLFPWWVGEQSHGRKSETLMQCWYAVTAVEAGRGREPQGWLTETGGENTDQSLNARLQREAHLTFVTCPQLFFLPLRLCFSLISFVTSSLLSSIYPFVMKADEVFYFETWIMVHPSGI